MFLINLKKSLIIITCPSLEEIQFQTEWQTKIWSLKNLSAFPTKKCTQLFKTHCTQFSTHSLTNSFFGLHYISFAEEWFLFSHVATSLKHPLSTIIKKNGFFFLNYFILFYFILFLKKTFKFSKAAFSLCVRRLHSLFFSISSISKNIPVLYTWWNC